MICLLMAFLTTTCFLVQTGNSERSCIFPGIPTAGPLIYKAEPPIRQIRQIKHDTLINFSCKSNYTLKGHKTIRCEDGRWTVFEQKEFLCMDPGEILYGKKNKKQQLYRPDATVRYWCNKGYATREATSTVFIRCTENGTWNRRPPKCIYCKSSLGIERSGPTLIPDSNIRASTEKDQLHRAMQGRLNGPRAWCSGRERTPYMEIDLEKPHKIMSLATQGSAFDKKWIGWYAVKSSTGGSLLTTYRENDKEKMFKGNTDASSIVKNSLQNPIIARKIRFYPMKSGGFLKENACMRVEIYGCELNE